MDGTTAPAAPAKTTDDLRADFEKAWNAVKTTAALFRAAAVTELEKAGVALHDDALKAFAALDARLQAVEAKLAPSESAKS